MSSSDRANAIDASQIADLRLAASKLTGAKRRSFQAQMSLKYCHGNARLTEMLFGWNRKTVGVGLEEKRSGMICSGAQSGFSGAKSWEQKNPEVAAALQILAEAHSQQDPTFNSTIADSHHLSKSEALSKGNFSE
jgi:hypothetical protein